MAYVVVMVSEIDVQEVVGYWPEEQREPITLDVGTIKGAVSSVAQKQNDAAQKAARALAKQKKKEATKVVVEKECMEKEDTAKEQA